MAAGLAEHSQARERPRRAQFLDVAQLPREQLSCLAARAQRVLACSGTSSSALEQAGGAESMREVGAMSSERVRAPPTVVSQLQLQLLLGLGARVRASRRAGSLACTRVLDPEGAVRREGAGTLVHM